jgi:hypothetical protein
MRKLICLLTIAVTASLGILTVPSAEAKKKPAPKPVNYDALKARLFDWYETDHVEYQKEKPDIENLLAFVAPSFKARYRALNEQLAAKPERFIQTRSIPVDIKRIVSIKKISKTTVGVRYCYVNSFIFQKRPESFKLDSGEYALVGSLDYQEWTLIKGEWYKGVQIVGPLLSEESQCLLAK